MITLFIKQIIDKVQRDAYYTEGGYRAVIQTTGQRKITKLGIVIKIIVINKGFKRVRRERRIRERKHYNPLKQ